MKAIIPVGPTRSFDVAVFSLGWTVFLNILVSPAHARDAVSKLTVRVYGFPGLSPSLLSSTEGEAARLLRQLHLQSVWLNCTLDCASPEAPDDLDVRVMEHALPEATASALGMAAWSAGDGGGAFIFYDRALALRAHAKLLGEILGRIMAHEIVHLLRPGEPHSDVGLMRAQWSAEELRFDSQALELLRQDRGAQRGRNR
jgi:hypothetical protein